MTQRNRYIVTYRYLFTFYDMYLWYEVRVYKTELARRVLSVSQDAVDGVGGAAPRAAGHHSLAAPTTTYQLLYLNFKIV